MLKERYCSPEVSLLLKEKGFNEEVISYYDIEGQHFTAPRKCNLGTVSVTAAPTLQMALEWLREKGIVITPVLSNVLDNKKFLWDIKIVVTETGYKYYKGWSFENQEDAINTAIKYCLETLI